MDFFEISIVARGNLQCYVTERKMQENGMRNSATTISEKEIYSKHL